MRQLFLDKGALAVQEVASPLLDEYSLLVDVHFSFMSSGTEIATIEQASKSVLFHNVPQKIKKVLACITEHGIEGTSSLVKSKLIGNVQTLGYSCSGKVIAVGGKVRTFRPGDFVACAGAGFANHADMVCVPEHLAVHVKEPFLKEASITTIGAIALQGVRRAQPQLGDIVCVIGLGLLGQITVQLAKLSGCTVIGIDVVQERLDLARTLGAHAVYNAGQQSLYDDILFLTQHHGVDATIITAASAQNSILQQAMEITRRKGKVVLVGDVGLNLERSPFYQKEIDFLISCSYGPGRYDYGYEQRSQDYPYAFVRWTENRNMQAFVHLVESGQISPEKLVCTEVDLDNIHEAYKKLAEKKCLGVIMRYARSKQKDLAITNTVPDQKHKKHTQLRVGIVGAGGFSKLKLIPLIKRIENTHITAIVDAQVTNAINMSRLHKNAIHLVDDQELYTQDLVDVVVISSPHVYHAKQTINALKNGKAVFLEKPMVTTFEQLQELAPFLLEQETPPFCVDYNRSFAPFVQKIKSVIAQRTTPLMIHYRMNAGFIPKDHWVQTEIGAGRIIGEACHIVDLFCSLVNATPRSVSVESLNTHRSDIGPSDNFSVHIRFDDGSLCNLMYTAIGNVKSGKERMEIFFDSKTIIMEDFMLLQGYGLPTSFNEKSSTAHKGHEELLQAFFTYLRTKNSPPPFTNEHLLQTAHLTLVIDALACKGGGEVSFSPNYEKRERTCTKT